MIRSSRHTLKFCTQTKHEVLCKVFDDFKKHLEFYINLIIHQQLPLKNNLSSKELPDFILNGGQYKQLIYKHASEIIRSQIKKSYERRFNSYKKIYSKALKSCKFKKFTNKKYSELKLKNILTSKYFTTPEIKNLSINFDNRFIDFKQLSLHFDEFVQLKLPYLKENSKTRRLDLRIPIKQHKHSLKFKDWNRKSSIQLQKINNNFYITFIYDKPEPDAKQQGEDLGIDIGYKKLLVTSNGKFLGNNLEQLYKKLSNKKRSSKNYQDSLEHKKNEINRVCNLLEIRNIKQIFIEDLKNVKHKSKFSRSFNNKLQYWSYKQVLEKLESLCQVNGVLLTKINPAYTSQTCSRCTTQDKSARQGERFACKVCNLEIDADLNASINILHKGIYSSFTTKNLE